MDAVLGLLLIGALLAFYFLPTLIGQHKRNAGAIFALNFFLGWTLLGWVVSLVWALSYEPPRTPDEQAAAAARGRISLMPAPPAPGQGPGWRQLVGWTLLSGLGLLVLLAAIGGSMVHH